MSSEIGDGGFLNRLLTPIQVLFWLVLRPSAWRDYVTHIHPDLRANFCLAELRSEQRRHPRLTRLFWLEFLVLPVLISGSVAVTLWLLGAPGQNILFGALVGLTACLGAGLIGGWVVSVAASWMAAAVGGGLAGIIFGLLGADSAIAFSTAFGGRKANLKMLVEAVLPPVLMASIPNGIAANIASSVETSNPSPVLGQRLGGIMLGILGSTLTLGIGGGIARYLVQQLHLSHQSLIAEFGNRFILGLILGIVFGLMLGRYTRRYQRDLAISITTSFFLTSLVNLAYHTPNDAIRGLAIGSGNAILLTVLFALAYTLTDAIAGVQAGAISGALGSSAIHTLFVSLTTGYPLWQPLLLSLLCLIPSLTLVQWLPLLLYPFEQAWNLFLYRLDEQQAQSGAFKQDYLHWHSAFWDERQSLPLWGLDRHLVILMEVAPQIAQLAIAQLSTSSQRWAARDAQIEWDARQLEQCQDLSAIATIHRQLTLSELDNPATQLLRGFRRLSQDAQAVLNQTSLYNQRLLLSHLIEQLDGFARELTRSLDGNVLRFRPIVQRWLAIAEQYQRSLVQQAEISQEIESPYIVGIPLTQQQEIFVGRQDVSAQIERLLREQRYSSLLLYGQRRMGKTSLLNHLGRLLPTQIIPLLIDLQGPASTATHHAGFLYNLAKGMTHSAQQSRNLTLAPLSRKTFADDPFTTFDEWLDDVEQRIAPATALLMLDEFEALNRALEVGRFDAHAVLGMLRNLIQHRTRFRVLLAGSHTLEEFQQWSSYLINLQVLHLSYLHESAARQLIEHPVLDFSLHYEPSATERIFQLTRCHPFLIQLLCSEVIALKNEQPRSVRWHVTLADIEAAISEALAHGSFFFADIEQNQLDREALPLLRLLANRGERAVMELGSDLLHQLVKKELLECVPGGYRFQIELIRRWFVTNEV